MKVLLLGIVVIFGFIALSTAWPVTFWLAMAFIAWRKMARRDGAWARAGSTIAMCCVAGLSVVCALSLLLARVDRGSNPNTITPVEESLVGLGQSATWVQPTALGYIAILTVLLFVRRFQPEMSFVMGSAGLRRFVGHGVLVLATITTFVFFAGSNLIGPAQAKVAAQITEARNEERALLARSLAIESVTRWLSGMSRPEADSLRAVFRGLDSVTDVQMEWKRLTVRHLVEAEPALVAADAQTKAIAEDAKLEGRAIEQLRTQRAAVASLQARVQESQIHLRKLARNVLSLPEGADDGQGWELVSEVVDATVPSFSEDHAALDYIAGELRDAAIEKAVEKIKAAWRRRSTAIATSSGKTAAAEVRSLMSIAALRRGEAAAATATTSAEAANAAIGLGNLEAGEKAAERAVASADDAARALSFAESQGAAALAVRNGAVVEQAGLAVAAAHAGRAAQSARAAKLAGQAASAAKAARAAAAAVRTARAAAAAKAAKAAWTVLRIL